MASIIWSVSGAPRETNPPWHEARTELPDQYPILVDDDMRLLEAPAAYLWERWRLSGRVNSVETIRTYAEGLVDFFDTLEGEAIDWQAVDIDVLAAWRNTMIQAPSLHTQRPLSARTVNQRVRIVCRFYRWALSKGLIAELPFEEEQVLVRYDDDQGGVLVHLRSQPNKATANVLTRRDHDTLPKAIPVSDLRKLLRELKPPYDLIARWGLATGMRRMELAAMTTLMIPDTPTLMAHDDPLHEQHLTITKGGHPRDILVPLRLLEETDRYLGEDRAALIKHRRQRTPSYRPPLIASHGGTVGEALWLTSWGTAVDKARLTAAIADAARAVGIQAHIHGLRHTFAMTMLVRLQQAAAHDPTINPLLSLQRLLGHASLTTTAIYLRAVQHHRQAIAEALDYLYGQVIDPADIEVGERH